MFDSVMRRVIPCSGMPMNRREFLQGAGAVLLAGVSGEACDVQPESTKSFDLKKEGRGMDLNVLHGEVANGFNQAVGEKLKALGNARAKDFHMQVFHNTDGSFSINMVAKIVPTKSGETADSVFEARSTVWFGKDAKKKVDENYQNNIAPWITRMRSAYPALSFREEEGWGGSGTLAYRFVMLVGG